MNLDCIAQLLINARLGTAQGTDVFQHHLPETSPDSSLLLKLPMDGIPINHYVVGLYKGRFQVILRSKSHAFGDGRAPLINKALTFYEQSFFDANANVLMRVFNCYPTTLPIVYPRTPGNEYEWSCNFLAHYIMPDQAYSSANVSGQSTVLPTVAGGTVQPNALAAALSALPDAQLLPLVQRMASVGNLSTVLTGAQMAAAIEAMSQSQLLALMQSLITALGPGTSSPPNTGVPYLNSSGFVVVAQ